MGSDYSIFVKELVSHIVNIKSLEIMRIQLSLVYK